MKSNHIHIALGFDNFYVVHIYAMLTSIFYNNRNNEITFHAIAPNVSEANQAELTTFVSDNNAIIIFHDVKGNVLEQNIVLTKDSYFTIATFYKWLFPSLVRAYTNKLLYLDPDIIVIGDLKELYNIDIGNAPIAAVTDSVVGVREDLGIQDKNDYFNAGVILLNVKNWLEQNITQKAIDFVKSYPGQMIYLDQDALNGTLAGHWFKLPNKYNFTTFDVKLQVPAKELVKQTVIVHFTSIRKPWNFLTRNKLRFLYHYYLKRSPRANAGKYTDFKYDLKSLWVFFRIRLKEFYFNHKLHTIFPIKKWLEPSWDY